MESLPLLLKKNIEGEVHFDSLHKKIYSVDASIYEVEPLGIVVPKHNEDLICALEIAAEQNVPVIPRGAATGITGGCLGKGIVIDLSKYFTNIIDINFDNEFAVCQAGVVQDRLNESLLPQGYRLGPDTSTGNRATLGGMLANNAAGARSLHYGRMIDHVESVELALAGGKILHCCEPDKHLWNEKLLQHDHEGHIYREISRIQESYRKEIIEKFPQIPRHASGYNLDQLIKDSPINLAKLICGSEGTLGIATQVKVRISKVLRSTGLCLIHVKDMIQTMHDVEAMLAFNPISLEMMDDKIIKMAKLSPLVRNQLEWLRGDPQAVFVAEFEGETPEEVERMLNNFSSKMQTLGIGYAHVLLNHPQAMNQVWEVRKRGLGLLLSKRTYSRAIAFIEDLAVAPKHLGSFMSELCSYLKKEGKEAGIYGHVGSGCMHIRPYIDLRKHEEISELARIMTDVSEIILSYSGSLSGEHGDGLIRTWLNKKMFGETLYRAFEELKAAFDPNNLMNPGKIVDGQSVTDNLRISPSVKQASISTFLDFSDEGGFGLAIDLCNGNGQCRKSEKVMCPSFQVSGDEYHTTRARAQSLRSIINGKLPADAFTSDALYDVLDLCLECKGCKTECPSEIDMAKMKAEFLYQYQEKNGYFFRNRLFGHIDAINRLTSPLASFFNVASRTAFSKAIKTWLGISPQRELPQLAQERFSAWFKKQPQQIGRQKVVLFNDTYTEFNHPEIGIAAYKILSELGYEILNFTNHCCGRPLISKGLLRQARAKARNLIEDLFEFAQSGFPIIGFEPSCLLTITHDFKGLIGIPTDGFQDKLSSICKVCTTFDEFLCTHLKDGKLPLPFIEQQKKILVHTHCHQKSLIGSTSTLQALRGVPGFQVEEIKAGCCGVAGSFGYEQEHYDFSMKIGNLHLLPAIRAAPSDTLVVANGMSCRNQILHGTQRRAIHMAEAIADQL